MGARNHCKCLRMVVEPKGLLRLRLATNRPMRCWMNWKEPAAVAVKSVRALKALELVLPLGFRRSSEGGWPTPLRR